jgi:acyl-CoA thioester hydrolase
MIDTIDLSALHYIGECFIPVRWNDLDTYGHVNNAIYFEYLTEGRTLVLQHLIKPMDDIQYFMVDARCVYLKPIDYPNNLKLKHYLKAMGHTSFTILCDIYSENESKHFARTECKLVCIDAATQKPIKVPDNLREMFS